MPKTVESKTAVRKAKARKPEPRGRGRPVSGRIDVQGEGMSRELILTRALSLAREHPLADLSMADLAKSMAVTPALIYYYIADRDSLTTGVINLFFKEKMQRCPVPCGQWQPDLLAFAKAMYAHDSEYAGIASYLSQHNRFRLFQRVAGGEVDYGLAYFNHAATILQTGGFTAAQTSLIYHLVMQHVLSSARARTWHLLPADHKDYIRGKLKAASPAQYPGAHFLADAFPELSADQAFDAGLQLILEGVSRWRPDKKAKTKASAKA